MSGNNPKRTFPDRYATRDKVVFANHAVAVLDEIQQQVEHLRLKRNGLGAPPKLPAIGVEYLIFKAPLHVRPRKRTNRNILN